MEVSRTSHSFLGTLGWEGQWDCDVYGGRTWESRGHPIVPRGLWDGKDSGTVMSLLGHGNPKSMVVGHGNPEDIPLSQGDFGMGRAVGL